MSRRVLVTGGSSGIGLETARAFLDGGADEVIICGRDADRLQAARAALGERVAGHVLDVRDQRAVDELFDALGSLDVLVAAAGVCEQARLDEPDSDAVWRRAIDINLHGAYHCVKAAARQMPGGGAMVTVSSGLGKNARAAYQAYAASKHGLLGLTRSVALELAGRGIRVNAVCPGWVDTPMSRADAAHGATRAGVPEAEFRARAIAGIPLGRMVQPAEVARLIRFLCSEDAAMITGQAYNIAGGEFMN